MYCRSYTKQPDLLHAWECNPTTSLHNTLIDHLLYSFPRLQSICSLVNRYINRNIYQRIFSLFLYLAPRLLFPLPYL